MSGGVIQIITLLSCTILIGGWLMWLKGSFQKKVIGQLLCEIITIEGNSYEKLFPVEHGVVEIPLKITGLKGRKRKQVGRTFLIKDIATFLSDYPLNWPKFLQAKAKKAIFHEACFIPVSMSKPRESEKLDYDPLLLPDSEACNQFPSDILYNIKNASDTEVLAMHSQIEAEHIGQQSSQLKPTTFYFWFGLILVAIAGLGYYMYSNMGEILESIAVLRAAAGV
ncbi:hypothetical protein KKE60_06490 [Patescibacteria group bacterium]|nr:hypothetical protein [Patescibacteria group bacterium]